MIDLPNIHLLECSIERVVPIETYIGTHQAANGLDHLSFDTNKDGRADVQVSIPTGDENRYPLFYAFDRDHVVDAQGLTSPEIVYADQARDGTCTGIIVYWVPGPRKES